MYQDLQDMTVMLGQPIKLHCEIYPGNVPGRWYRNGQLIQPNDRVNIIHRNKYVISLKLCSIKNKFTQMLTNIILLFKGPPSWNCDQLPSWCGRLHICTWGIFTEPLCQTSHHWYTTMALSDCRTLHLDIILKKRLLYTCNICYDVDDLIFCRPTEGAPGQLELPRQHGDNCGRNQTSLGDPHQWRTSTQGGVDEGRKGELQST